MTPQHFRTIAIVLAVLSACMSAYFGWHQSSDLLLALCMAIGLACAGLLSPFVWPAVLALFRQGDWTKAAIAAVFGVIATGMDITSNFGSIAWQRTTDITEASMQSARYEDKRDEVADNAALLKTMQDQLASLQSQHAWAATVTADGLRAKLTELQAAADREAARGGCGPRCEAIKRDVIETQSRIATAEQRQDLERRIAATQAVLAKARDKAATVDKPTSAVGTQNVVFASLASASLKPSVEAQHWTNQGLGMIIALFFTFAGMGAAFLGMDERRTSRSEPTASRIVPADRPITVEPEPVTYPAPARHAEPHRLRLTTIDQLRRLASTQAQAA